MLVCDWAQKILLCPIRGQHLSHCIHDLLMRRSLPAKSGLVILRSWKFVSRQSGSCRSWESSLQEEFSVKCAPTVYSTNLIWSSCITEEKILTTNLQTLKGERISLARAWQVWRAGVTNHADDSRSTLVSKNYTSISPQAISKFFVSFWLANMLKTVLLSPTRFQYVTNAHFIREFHNTTKNMICILMIYLSEEEFEEISWVWHLCY